MEIDWKKKYEEAQLRMRQHVESGIINAIYAESIFPELAESEDEKNATALIRLLNNEKVSSLITFEAKQQWLDWLEQKKTPSVSFEPAAGFDSGSAVVYHNDESEDERIRKELIEFLREAYSRGNAPEKCAKWLVWLDWSKEQQPAEKQDYSDLNGLERAIHRGFLSAGVENAPVTIIKETAQECISQMKPAEWSEEDVTMYAKVLFCFQSLAFPTDEERHEIMSWLKSLKNRGNSPKKNSNSPSWKPSEEQMRALQVVVDEHWDVDGDALYSLYTDLKKLM